MKAAAPIGRRQTQKDASRTARSLKLETRLGVADVSLWVGGFRVRLELPRPDAEHPWVITISVDLPSDLYEANATVSIRGEVKDLDDYRIGGRTARKALVDAVAAVAEALAANESAELERLVGAMLDHRETEAATEHRRAAAAAERWRRRPRKLTVRRWRY